jgi:glycosyltransferase involved in cell wall biosynthesis
VPLGVSPEFSPQGSDSPVRDAQVAAILDQPDDAPFLLHVGSCIPRKRIDVLLDVFAAVKCHRPELRLIQIGGEFTEPQREQIKRLGIESAVKQVRGVSRGTIAALYRQARLVLQPSEAEGFGLPVIEALACGATVVASDIPALREVGGDAAIFCKVGDVTGWAEAIERLLADSTQAPPPAIRLAQAGKYSWAEHTRRILEAYGRLASGPLSPVLGGEGA